MLVGLMDAPAAPADPAKFVIAAGVVVPLTLEVMEPELMELVCMAVKLAEPPLVPVVVLTSP